MKNEDFIGGFHSQCKMQKFLTIIMPCEFHTDLKTSPKKPLKLLGIEDRKLICPI